MQKDELSDEQYKFIFDEQRTTVALSRAREGLFVIGDSNLLKLSKIWSRFLSGPPEMILPVEKFKNFLQQHPLSQEFAGRRMF